jgi:RNA polymerase sigma factor (sigma-70 family)
MFAVSPAAASSPELNTDCDASFARKGRSILSATNRRLGLQDLQLRDLMRSAQVGNGRAYAELLGAITPRLRHIISNQRKFLQAADIEDLVQEILLSLHSVRDTYDPERPFMPWLMAITHHRLADAARRYHSQVARQNELEAMSVTFGEGATNMEADSYGNAEVLKRAIECLPPRQRTAIQLLKLREMSLKEAAAASGSSIDALKVAVHRAMVTLRQTLRGELDRKPSSASVLR